jgi:hypothetical protein
VGVAGPDPTVPVVRCGPHLTVVTDIDAPTADRIGHWLAGVIAGHIGEGVSGVVELAGRPVALHDAPPLPPDVPVILSADDFEAHRRARVDRQSGEIAQRREELDRGASDLAATRRALEAALGALAQERGAAEAELAQLRERLDVASVRRRVAEALRVLRTTERRPVQAPAEALELAERWEHVRLARSAIERSGSPPSIDECEARVEQARAHVAEIDAGAEGVSNEAAAHIQSLHEEVERAERALDRAKRGQRRQIEASVEAAVRHESDALARYGFPSRASFLVALAQGAPAPDANEIRHRAVEELEAALALLDSARELERVAGGRDLAEVEVELRGEAASLLGRFPGVDVAGELRAMRPDADELRVQRDELAARLADAGVELTTNDYASVTTAAEEWLASNPPDTPEHLGEIEARVVALEAELTALAERSDSRDLKLESVHREQRAVATSLAELDDLMGSFDTNLPSFDDLDEVLGAARREGQSAPIVLSGMFRDLAPSELAPVLERLREAARRTQLIIVTDVPAVGAWARKVESGVKVWTPADAREEAERLAEREAEEQRAREAKELAEREATARALREAEQRAVREAEDQAVRQATKRATREPDARSAKRAADHAAREAAQAERAAAALAAREAEEAAQRAERQRAARAAAAEKRVAQQAASQPPAIEPEPAVARARPTPVPASKRAKRGKGKRNEVSDLQERQARARAEREERLRRFGIVPSNGEGAPVPVARPAPARTSGEVPWARFERELRRRQTGGGNGSETAGPERRVMCRSHRLIRAELECERCHDHFCEQCLVPVKDQIVCIDCALVAAGARSRRRRR